MTDLSKTARDQECTIRVPGVCNGRTDLTVLCHVRMIGISGYGLKAPDALAAFGCQPCHDYVDARTHPKVSPEERRLLLLEGVMRTQAQWIKAKVLKW